MRYGKNSEIKNYTLYFSPEMFSVIGEVDNYRDLGFQHENTGNFNIHISNIIKKSKENYWMDSEIFFQQICNFPKENVGITN